MTIFACGFIGPLTLYLYAAHPAWSWMYLVEPGSVHSLAVLPMTIGQAVAVLMAWYVGATLIRADKQRALGIASAAGAGIVALFILLARGRLGSYGSFEDYAEGRTLGLMDVKLGYVLVAIGLGVCAAALYLAYVLLRDSRRVRTRN